MSRIGIIFWWLVQSMYGCVKPIRCFIGTYFIQIAKWDRKECHGISKCDDVVVSYVINIEHNSCKIHEVLTVLYTIKWLPSRNSWRSMSQGRNRFTNIRCYNIVIRLRGFVAILFHGLMVGRREIGVHNCRSRRRNNGSRRGGGSRICWVGIPNSSDTEFVCVCVYVCVCVC